MCALAISYQLSKGRGYTDHASIKFLMIMHSKVLSLLGYTKTAITGMYKCIHVAISYSYI